LPPEISLSVAASEWPRSRVLSWIYFAVGVLAVAFVLRYAVIEPHTIGIACGEDVTPWWCAPRQAVVLMHAWYAWGTLGLLGGALALVFGWGWALRLGFAMSLMGLVLYNADYAAPGLVLTLLRLPRS
jgi:hypothetical protein